MTSKKQILIIEIRIIKVILELRVGSKITWHSVSKMSGLYGTFADSLGQVIFVRSLTNGERGSFDNPLTGPFTTLLLPDQDEPFFVPNLSNSIKTIETTQQTLAESLLI